MVFGLKNIFTSLKGNTTIRPTKVVGIDFGSSSVKVVEINLREDVLALSTYGELQLGPYAESGLGSAVKLPVEKRIQALVDIMRESGVDTKDGVMALPLSDSFVTVMSLTAKKEENISTRVPVEARKYIPVPLNDIKLEWSEIPQGENEQALTREVLLAAIQNEAFADMKTLLNAVQMATQPFEIELFSTLRATTRDTDESIAVIDVGAQMSKLYIAQEGFLRRIHRVRAGGMHATEALAKDLGISFEDAENKKRNYTANGKDSVEIKKVMSNAFDRPFQEFKRVIMQHEARTGKPITRVVLTGGSALFYDFASYASYMLDRETELTNPFSKVAYPAFMEDQLKSIGPIFATAVGAALRTFEQ
jgi:type IV pilus assembly protein PilM